jgi:hypothetical protein
VIPKGGPFHLAGPYVAALACIARAAAKLGLAPARPEHVASLFADLMTAGASAATAQRVLELCDGLPSEAGLDPVRLFEEEEKLRQRVRALLGAELSPSQLHAFDLGCQLCAATAASGAHWDPVSEQRALVTDRLARAIQACIPLNLPTASVSMIAEAAGRATSSEQFQAIAALLKEASNAFLKELYNRR